MLIGALITGQVLSNVFSWMTEDCPEVPHFELSIQPEHWEKITAKREIALQNSTLQATSDDYVPGKLTYAADDHEVELRLKGDHPDHYDGPRWSFRIKTGKHDKVMGLRRFSIQDPKTRKYLFEWIFHRLQQYEGLFYLDYRFVSVSINGDEKGIYAMEEHFSKELIKKMDRHKSVIIKFNEDQYWADYIANKESNHTAYDLKCYQEAQIDTYQPGQLEDSERQRARFDRAKELLSGFRDGNLTASEVFDVPQTARFLAISDLMNLRHANRWHNKRWYYNPDSDKLEPVGFDGDARKLKVLLADNPFLNAAHREALFADQQLLQAYVNELERMSEPKYLDQFFDGLSSDYNCQSGIFVKNFIDLNIHHYKAWIYENQEVIRELLPEFKERHGL